MKVTANLIDALIQKQWDKEVTNQSEARFRAQELTRLYEIKEKLWKKKQ